MRKLFSVLFALGALAFVMPAVANESAEAPKEEAPKKGKKAKKEEKKEGEKEEGHEGHKH